MIMQRVFIISFASLFSNENQIVSFAQLNLQVETQAQVWPWPAPAPAPLAPPADLATAQLTMNSFIDQAEISYQPVAEKILFAWEAKKTHSKFEGSPLPAVSRRNWPKWILEIKKLGESLKEGKDAGENVDLMKVVEAILRVGYWFEHRQRIMPNSDITFDETHARQYFRSFLSNWERTQGEKYQAFSCQRLADRDQFLIKSNEVQMFLGDVDLYKQVRNIRVHGRTIVEPEADAQLRIYKFNTVTRKWNEQHREKGYAEPAAFPILVDLVKGFRAETAFHITNGAHAEDGIQAWKDINDPTKQVSELWGESIVSGNVTEQDQRNIQIWTQFKVNSSGKEPKMVVNKESATPDSWTKALERYTDTVAHKKLVKSFVKLLYGYGGHGNLATAENVMANTGRVHALFTRHAVSCANLAKALGQWHDYADWILIPFLIRKAAASIAKWRGSAFLDTRLSDLGVQNSVHGGYKLAAACAKNKIPAPTKVFTSTMQRTVETARNMMEGMTAYAKDKHVADKAKEHGWAAFDVANKPMTIMPGIKEEDSSLIPGYENTPRTTLRGLTKRLNLDNPDVDYTQKVETCYTDNTKTQVAEADCATSKDDCEACNGVWHKEWIVQPEVLDTTWITGHGSTWAENRETDSIDYFQEKLGMNFRETMGEPTADGANNIAEESAFIVTHSHQMKKWFQAFVGDNKPNNNDTWRFRYIRIPGETSDDFVLIEDPPANADAAPGLYRVGNVDGVDGYEGFQGRNPKELDVAPKKHSMLTAVTNIKTEHCTRCNSWWLTTYAYNWEYYGN